MDLVAISYLLLWALVLVNSAIILVLLKTFGSFYLGTRQGINRDGLPIGSKAPVFEGDLVAGGRMGLNDLRGKWLVLFFAAPSCDDCYRLLPSLTALRDDLGRLLNLAIMFQGSVEEARAIPHLQGSTLPIIAIGRHGVAERYRVRVSPFVQVLDAEGVVREKGLANSRESLEHLLGQAGVDHPLTQRHMTELVSEEAASNA